MEFKDFIKYVLQSNKSYKAALILTMILTVLQIGGLSSDFWLDGENHQGLWNYCEYKGVYECCSTVDFHLAQTRSTIPAFIDATRVFQCAGLIFAVVDLFLLCILIRKTYLKRVAFILSGLSGVCIITGVIIYGASSRNWPETSQLSLSHSFRICTAAGICFLFMVVGIVATKNFPRSTRVSDALDNVTDPTEQGTRSYSRNQRVVDPNDRRDNVTNPRAQRTRAHSRGERVVDPNDRRDNVTNPRAQRTRAHSRGERVVDPQNVRTHLNTDDQEVPPPSYNSLFS